MVKLGPDVKNGRTDAYSGYLPEGNIWGFSMMHESGTGGAPKLVFLGRTNVLFFLINMFFLDMALYHRCQSWVAFGIRC